MDDRVNTGDRLVDALPGRQIALLAYARFQPAEFARYRDGLLPDG